MKHKTNKKNITPPAFCITALIVSVITIAAAFFACSAPDNTPEDTNDQSSSPAPDTSDVTDTKQEDDEHDTLDFINPLTGINTNIDLENTRPVAVMINNISQSLPQNGISNADIIYECITEGLVTRLMLLTSDYESLGAIGSVRSTRPYFLELAMGHDAIIAHAGASNAAYEMISEYGIDNLDGVNMYLPDGVFYRDEKRLETMSYEHTMMTSGKGIISGIAYKKYRSSKSENKTAFAFAKDKADLQANDSKTQKISFSYSDDNTIDYIFDEETGQYLRYQYNGAPHIDGSNQKQLSFTNVIVLSCIHTPLNDAERHVDITLTGKGEGYLFTNGSLYYINWQKDSKDSSLKLYYSDGSEAILNVGKTFINIVSESIFGNISIQ